MKKICILNHGLASGGTDSFVITLAKELAADGYDVTMALAVDPDSAPQFREDEVRSITGKGSVSIYKTSDLDGIKKKLRHAKRLYRLLKDGRYDVFHANMDLFNGVNMFAAWLAKVPVRVCHSHNSQSQYEADTGKHFAVRIYRSVMRHLLWKYSNRRCGCSDSAMDYLFCSRWKKDNHSAVVYNGIDFTRFSYENFDREEMKKELGLPQGRLLITVGRLAEQKNPMFTIDVMMQLHKIHPDCHLLWIGEGAMRLQLEEKIREWEAESYIHLLGTRKNVNNYLRCADAFLMPSLFEGLPIAPIEAQAANLPCILSDCVSAQVDLGKCVFIPLKDGAAAWADRIRDVLEGKICLKIDPEKKRKFDQKYMAKQVEQIYE